MASSVLEGNLTEYSTANMPAAAIPDKIYNYFDVIAYNPGGGTILLCASSLTSAIWKGSAWIFKDSYFKSASGVKPVPGASLTGISVETGISAALFLNESRLVLGCDSGVLRLHEITDEPAAGDASRVQLQLLGYYNEHSSAVLGLDILEKEKSVISCSQDSSIIVWDVFNLISHHTYSPAHIRDITSVKSQLNSNHTFASSSLDGSALFWDVRASKPARCLREVCGIGLTAVTWADSNKVVLGTVAGEVDIMDIRKLTEPHESIKLVPRPVHQLHSCPQDSSLISVCQDSSQFTVIKCEDIGTPQIVYKNDQHEDFVRCAAWHPTKKSVVICSWDSTVSSHLPQSIKDVSVNGF